MNRIRTTFVAAATCVALASLSPVTDTDAVAQVPRESARVGIVTDGSLRLPRVVLANQTTDVTGFLDRRGRRPVRLEKRDESDGTWLALARTTTNRRGDFRFDDVLFYSTPVGGLPPPFTVRAFAPRVAGRGAVATPKRIVVVEFPKPDMSGQLTFASVSSDERLGAGDSGEGDRTYSVSGDGRYVAFASGSAWADPTRRLGGTQIFVRDRTIGVTTLVTRTLDGTQGIGWSSAPVISANGEWVFYSSTSPRLVQGDGNGVTDLFAWHRRTDTTSLVEGVPKGDGGIDALSVSPNGRFLAFRTGRPDLPPDPVDVAGDLYVLDRTTGVAEQLPTPAHLPSPEDFALSMSDDGRYVAYAVNVPDPDAGLNPYDRELKFVDRKLGTTTLVPLEPSAERRDYDDLESTAMTADGGLLAYSAPLDDPRYIDDDRAIFLWDSTTESATPVPQTMIPNDYTAFPTHPDLSADGRFLSFFSVVSGSEKFFRLDLETDAVDDALPDPPMGYTSTEPPVLSDDGSVLVFSFKTFGTEVLPGDVNWTSDVFAWDARWTG